MDNEPNTFDQPREGDKSGETIPRPNQSVPENTGLGGGDGNAQVEFPPVEPITMMSSEGKKTNGKVIGLIVLAVLLVGAGVFGVMKLRGLRGTTGDEEREYEYSTSEFDLSFLKLEENKKNMIYSPLSIKYGLSLLKDGASGETKTEIENVLGDTKLTKYVNEEDVLSLANAVFIRDNYADSVLPTYISGVEQAYDAEVIYDTFDNASKINNWVSEKTFGLIPDAGISVDFSTKMVLTNALAIQMDWQSKFDAESTHGAEFTKADGSKIEVTMMKDKDYKDDINYYVDNNVTVVSKKLKEYGGVQLEFIAIMPKNDLSKYVDGVKTSDIDKLLSMRKPASTVDDGVVLYIPKFKFDYELQFKEDLDSLGIKKAFALDADFSQMSRNDLSVDKAVHKAIIDFSEKGIKAAAVTGFAMKAGAAIEEPLEIKIDRPFVFMIRDIKTKENWFVGVVYEPNLWENDKNDYSYRY